MLPVRLAGDSPTTHAGVGALNVNRGAGVQRIHDQSGGSGNQQFNSDNIYYLNIHPPGKEASLLSASTTLTLVRRTRTRRDAAVAILHRPDSRRSGFCGATGSSQ